MTLTQTKPQTQVQPKIWEAPTAEAEINDIIRKPFCPIARVVGKEFLKDGRTCLIVTFPNASDRHVEEWVVGEAQAQPAVVEQPTTPTPTTPTTTVKPATKKLMPFKKLMPLLVAVKRITSDVPASNFDRSELEEAAKQCLELGGFYAPPVVMRDGDSYKVVSGHFQYHAAAIAREMNPKAGETIPAFVIEVVESIESEEAEAVNCQLPAKPTNYFKNHPFRYRHDIFQGQHSVSSAIYRLCECNKCKSPKLMEAAAG
jgi:hypothetical protein